MCHNTSRYIVNVGATNNNSVLLDYTDKNNDYINNVRNHILMMCDNSKWSIINGSCAHQCGSIRSQYTSADHNYVPYPCTQQCFSTEKTEVWSPFKQTWMVCYFQLREKKLHLFLFTEARAILRLLLAFVVTQYSYYSLHCVIFRTTEMIHYLLSPFMILYFDFVLLFCMKLGFFPSIGRPSAHLSNRKLQVKS